ncbi:MAG: 30S ribosomal protein S6 [Candidatus Limnocylindria bacterium]
MRNRPGFRPGRLFAPDQGSPSPLTGPQDVRGRPRKGRWDHRMRPYELMYLVQPTADEERLTAVSDRLQQSIGSLGGKIEKVTPPIRRRLAYEIGKYRDGQYGVLEYSLPPEQSREFERTIKLTEDILRHIVIRRDE